MTTAAAMGGRTLTMVVALTATISVSSGANILGIFPSSSVSHQVVFQPIWRELSLRGHNVTVITPDPIRDPSLTNLTEIDVSFAYQYFDLSPVFGLNLTPDQTLEAFYLELWPPSFEEEMQHPQVQKLLDDNGDTKFDVVLAEMLYAPSYGFAWKYKCPWIGILSLPSLMPNEMAIGNPIHPVVNPDYLLGYTGKLSFWQRLISTYSNLRTMYNYHFRIMPEMDKMARKYFGKDLPYLGDLERTASLMFSNVNMMTNLPKPQVPSVIEMGMMHIQKNATLPPELEQEMDEATQGIVYVSLGSNVKSANLSCNLKEILLATFAELPFKVLWKYETGYLPEQPSNVLIGKWLPQQAILGHPNVKVFVTQGGFQSMEEAIYNKKPMVGLPFFFDQEMNVQQMIHNGIGVKVDIHTITKNELKMKIMEVARNKKYHEKIAEMRDLVLDQPMTGLEKAVWWTEYVIRHKGAERLRSSLLDMPFYQYFLLDVAIFVILALAAGLGILYGLFVFSKPVLAQIVKHLLLNDDKKLKAL